MPKPKQDRALSQDSTATPEAEVNPSAISQTQNNNTDENMVNKTTPAVPESTWNKYSEENSKKLKELSEMIKIFGSSANDYQLLRFEVGKEILLMDMMWPLLDDKGSSFYDFIAEEFPELSGLSWNFKKMFLLTIAYINSKKRALEGRLTLKQALQDHSLSEEVKQSMLETGESNLSVIAELKDEDYAFFVLDCFIDYGKGCDKNTLQYIVKNIPFNDIPLFDDKIDFDLLRPLAAEWKRKSRFTSSNKIRSTNKTFLGREINRKTDKLAELVSAAGMNFTLKSGKFYLNAIEIGELNINVTKEDAVGKYATTIMTHLSQIIETYLNNLTK